MIEVLECDRDVTVTTTTELHHLCPFKDEADHGFVHIEWRVNGSTLELHSLQEYLQQFIDTRISHEAITDRIRAYLTAIPGITDVQVSTDWHTAGFAVHVKGGEDDALLRQPVNAEGA